MFKGKQGVFSKATKTHSYFLFRVPTKLCVFNVDGLMCDWKGRATIATSKPPANHYTELINMYTIVKHN